MKQWHLSNNNLPFLVDELKKLDLNKHWVIEIKEKRNNRTNEQNARLWGFLYPSLSNYFGYTVDEIHILMGAKFLKQLKIINNETVEVIKSTTSLSIEDMISYQQQIEIWATQMGWSA
jgi:hypothetical protein